MSLKCLMSGKPFLVLPCRHLFCKLCLRRWLDISKSCASCPRPAEPDQMVELPMVESLIKRYMSTQPRDSKAIRNNCVRAATSVRAGGNGQGGAEFRAIDSDVRSASASSDQTVSFRFEHCHTEPLDARRPVAIGVGAKLMS